MFTGKNIVLKLILISYLLLEACTSSDINPQKIIIGKWNKEPEAKLGYFSYTDVTYIFKSDSFFLSTTFDSDVMGGDSCKTRAVTQYAAGKYTILDEKIFLKGNWTEKDYSKIIDTGCFNKGSIDWTYFFKFLDNNTIIINSKSDDFEFYEDRPNYSKIRLIRIN